ncbi:MAG TPA: chemotaxis protein CheW [Candidatus Limnocylindrales bacterium]|nr:chemotaxis protein CheW [Candidatus Limnocylindrales bacterium]
MQCPQCHHENPEGAKFCKVCKTRLEISCPGCGHVNPPGSYFCNQCGFNLARLQNPTPNSAQFHQQSGKEVYSRLKAARAILEGGFVPTPEEKKKILRARARVLAQEPKEKEADGERIEVVKFLLAHENYGIESVYVREVHPLKELTPLPCTPPFVLGIINVRGQILSVIDLKKFFDLPAQEPTHLNKVIILHNHRIEFGILAEAVVGVQWIPLQDIQPSFSTLTGVREEYLKGVTRERLVILDAERILSDKSLIVHEEVE